MPRLGCASVDGRMRQRKKWR